MGRPKKVKPVDPSEVQPNDPRQTDMFNGTGNPKELIAEYHRLKEHADTQSKAFQEYLKPTNVRIEEIRQALHAMMLAQKVNGFPTDEGTAYLSTIVSHKIDPDSTYKDASGRDALLDWMLDNWDKYGSEGMLLSISKAVVDAYMQDNEGKPPPGLKLDSFTRVNIKRS